MSVTCTSDIQVPPPVAAAQIASGRIFCCAGELYFPRVPLSEMMIAWVSDHSDSMSVWVTQRAMARTS